MESGSPPSLRIAAAQRHEAVEIDLRVAAVLVEVVVNQAGIEQIDAGGHRRVGGENVVDARGFERFFETTGPGAR